MIGQRPRVLAVRAMGALLEEKSGREDAADSNRW
jgi:hypothetical protein